MGDQNQLAYLRHWVPKADGPVLEVGSKEYGSTASFRDFYAGVEYAGADNRMATLVDAGKGLKRKYLPYLKVNMLGKRRAMDT